MAFKRFRWLFLVAAIVMGIPCWAQQTLSPEVQQMQQSAASYLQQRDYANSIMLLNQAIRLAPDNVSLRRDLAYTYFLSGKAEKAEEVIQPVVSSAFADEQTFQVAAAIENVLGKYRKAKRILETGIAKFPQSGLLYNNLGNLYSTSRSDKTALQAWQKGINVDPEFSRNYYAAALMYHSSKDNVWALVYGEIYLTKAQDTALENQVKKMMIDAYRAILTGGTNENLPAFGGNTKVVVTSNTSFENAFKSVLSDNAAAVAGGFDAESLTMLRTRFLMEWETKFAGRFPLSLFTWQDRLIRAGYFDAYNQWLFGAVTDKRSFQLWTVKFSENFSDFETWMKLNPIQLSSDDVQPQLN